MFLMPVLSLFNPIQSCSGWLRHVTTSGVLCMGVLSASLAHASPSVIAEVQALLDSGKTNEAAQVIRNEIKQNSSDVQLRFLQGVVAAEQKKYDQAIQVFTTLTQDYPGLPEPYNNLAVLYAAKGDERKAAQVLEQAIRTNPSYATAHENLGDLYARMASDAYAKALQLDNSRKALQPKLALIKQLFPLQAPTSAAEHVPTAKTAAPATHEPTAATDIVEAPRPAVSAPITTTSLSESPLVASSSASKLAATTTEPEKKSVAPAVAEVKLGPNAASDGAEKTTPESTAQKEVATAVMAWANAWSKQNLKAYYASYSDQFKPSNGTSLAEWKAERKDRIVSKDTITVNVRDLRINVHGQRATAVFRQHYAAGAFKATTIKTLNMQRDGSRWLIVREETGG